MNTFTTAYDDIIQAASARWLPEWDWRWWKAEIAAESLFDPKAVSPAGAEGLAQFMPPTWKQVCKALHYPITASPFDPLLAIPAGAYYLARMRSAWWMGPRSEDDRRRLSQASYNAGLGTILKAQKKANNALDYARIVAQLDKVSGKRADETRGYVERIERYFEEMTRR